MNLDGEIAQRSNAAADEVLRRYDVDRKSCDADAVAGTLEVFASLDLLNFGFSDPVASGPQQGDMTKACEVISTLAGRSGTLASIYMVSGLLGPLCVSYAGTAAQKAALLPRAAQGKLQLAFALTEPGAGSDAASISTRASLKDDGYLLNGEKIYITGAATAEILLVVAKSSAKNPKAFGIFLVPKDAKGLSVDPLGKIASNLHASCGVKLEDVRLGTDAVLGSAEGAWSVLRNTGTLERLIVSAIACGLARAATDRASAFIRNRHQFGQPLKNFQAIQHSVVEMSTLTTGMQLFVENALREQARNKDATRAISMAKYFCSEKLQQIVGTAVRVMGGRAYFDLEPVSRFYREAPFCLFAGGTIEIQKMLIARSLAL
jgi:alkylation response protein AidB-like acyl-CoA dehydrogenase